MHRSVLCASACSVKYVGIWDGHKNKQMLSKIVVSFTIPESNIFCLAKVKVDLIFGYFMSTFFMLCTNL